jgi:SAM-dependent methyltransferase
MPLNTPQSHHTAMGPPSEWVKRWTHLVPENATVLDIACGSGRHLQWLLQKGFLVTGVDRDIGTAQRAGITCSLVLADIENQPWPLMVHGAPQAFGAVIVTNYLWRPLWATILQSVQPGGVLLYETFAAGNETVGRPSRPDFLLQHGELLEVCRGWRVVAFEDGYVENPPRFVQRIAAIRPLPDSDMEIGVRRATMRHTL